MMMPELRAVRETLLDAILACVENPIPEGGTQVDDVKFVDTGVVAFFNGTDQAYDGYRSTREYRGWAHFDLEENMTLRWAYNGDPLAEPSEYAGQFATRIVAPAEVPSWIVLKAGDVIHSGIARLTVSHVWNWPADDAVGCQCAAIGSYSRLRILEHLEDDSDSWWYKGEHYELVRTGVPGEYRLVD